MKEKGNLTELVDKSLGSDFNEAEAIVMIKVALLCTSITPTLRPTMSSVLSMLEGRTSVQEVVPESTEALDEKKLEAMRQRYQQIEGTKEISSSASAADLYPVNLNSS